MARTVRRHRCRRLAAVNLADNRPFIEEAVASGLLAGAVTLVWHRGEVLQTNAIGHRDVDAGLPMRRDTIFRIASMTKPIAGASLMLLSEEGKLDIHDVHFDIKCGTLSVLSHSRGEFFPL